MKDNIKFYCLLLTQISLLGCFNNANKNGKNVVKYDTVKLFYSNGYLESVLIYRNKKLQDTAKYYYSNGVLERKIVYSDSLPNGQCLNYYPNGKIRLEGYFKNGKSD